MYIHIIVITYARGLFPKCTCKSQTRGRHTWVRGIYVSGNRPSQKSSLQHCEKSIWRVLGIILDSIEILILGIELKSEILESPIASSWKFCIAYMYRIYYSAMTPNIKGADSAYSTVFEPHPVLTWIRAPKDNTLTSV